MNVSKRFQRGQGLTEFLAISLILVPIFLALPLIAKYQDIAHATEMAARYVAFDAAVRNDQSSSWKTAAELAGEVRQRFYSNPTAPIKTGDVAGDFKANQNLFWRDPQDKALIRNFDTDVRISFGEALSEDRLAGFKAAGEGDGFPLSEAMQLEARGIYRANVSVTLANLSTDLVGPTKSYDFFKTIDLKITRHTDLLIDPWTARDPQHVEERINDPLVWSGSVFNTGAGDALSTVVDTAYALMELPKMCLNCGPKLGKLDYWRDEVPADRRQ